MFDDKLLMIVLILKPKSVFVDKPDICAVTVSPFDMLVKPSNPLFVTASVAPLRFDITFPSETVTFMPLTKTFMKFPPLLSITLIVAFIS